MKRFVIKFKEGHSGNIDIHAIQVLPDIRKVILRAGVIKPGLVVEKPPVTHTKVFSIQADMTYDFFEAMASIFEELKKKRKNMKIVSREFRFAYGSAVIVINAKYIDPIYSENDPLPIKLDEDFLVKRLTSDFIKVRDEDR